MNGRQDERDKCSQNEKSPSTKLCTFLIYLVHFLLDWQLPEGRLFRVLVTAFIAWSRTPIWSQTAWIQNPSSPSLLCDSWTTSLGPQVAQLKNGCHDSASPIVWSEQNFPGKFLAHGRWSVEYLRDKIVTYKDIAMSTLFHWAKMHVSPAFEPFWKWNEFYSQWCLQIIIDNVFFHSHWHLKYYWSLDLMTFNKQMTYIRWKYVISDFQVLWLKKL